MGCADTGVIVTCQCENKCVKAPTFGSKVAKNLMKGWNSSAASSYSMKS